MNQRLAAYDLGFVSGMVVQRLKLQYRLARYAAADKLLGSWDDGSIAVASVRRLKDCLRELGDDLRPDIARQARRSVKALARWARRAAQGLPLFGMGMSGVGPSMELRAAMDAGARLLTLLASVLAGTRRLSCWRELGAAIAGNLCPSEGDPSGGRLAEIRMAVSKLPPSLMGHFPELAALRDAPAAAGQTSEISLLTQALKARNTGAKDSKAGDALPDLLMELDGRIRHGLLRAPKTELDFKKDPRHCQARLNGEPYPVEIDQVNILECLLNARGEFVSSTAMKPKLGRPAYIIMRAMHDLPEPLRQLIEAKGGPKGGYRLKLD